MSTVRFVPHVKAFFCSWWTKENAQRAGLSRFSPLAELAVQRVGCTSHLHPATVLQAFREGADGVWISGCQPGDCQDLKANSYARRQYYILKKLLVHVGLEPQRLLVTWISAHEISLFSDAAAQLVQGLHQVGPVKWRHHIAPRLGDARA